MRTSLVSAALFALVFTLSTVPNGNAQTLPQLTIDTTYPAMSGTTIPVPAGGSFQNALDMAQPGDTITLQAGATYTGNFTLRSKSGTGWIVIRTSAPDSSLPPQGRRITPAYASVLPKIVTTNSEPALQTASGAHHYRLVGVEVTTSPGASINYGLVVFGSGSSHLVLDRVYIHGQPNNNMRRGVAFNSAWTAAVDSYISECHEIGADSQAIAGWNGPGPFKIVNNYLEGAGENVLFGGADPSVNNLVPSDIEIRGNHLYKPLRWKVGHPTYAGFQWSVKNSFELKNARRVLVDGNIFENNWLHAQQGFMILFTPRNQDGGSPWSVVEDVTFTHNIIRHTGSAVNMFGWDDIHDSQQTKRILIRNNVFEDVSSTWGGNGRLFQVRDGTLNVTIDHNTGFQTAEFIVGDPEPNLGFVYTNNITPHNQYGIGGTGTFGNPGATLSQYYPGAVFRRNVIQGGSASRFPADNFFPPSMSDVGFVNLAGGDYRLQSTSPYKNAGTDGKDVGADINAVNAATAGAINGNGPGEPPPPPPPDTTAPSVAVSSPANGATVSGAVTISANASDNVGVAGVRFLVDGSTVGSEDTAAPYQASWNTAAASNGSHTITAIARDAAGNSTTSAAVTVTVANTVPDTTAPAVSITAPANGATVSGVTSISANASDNIGVAGVRFFVDGSPLAAEDTAAPYQASWNTAAATNGSHSLTAVARDAAGNSTTSATVNVTVSNAPAAQTPFSGTAAAIPGRFEAEDFDRGGEGVAYHDVVPGNQGGLYRTTEDVDVISPYAGGHVVNNFQTGEWLEYTIDVAQAGTFLFEALVSSEFTTSRFQVAIDGTNSTGAVDVPNTGSWRTFQWVGRGGISVAAGQHVLRITADVEYFNLDAIRLTQETVADTTPPAVAITGPGGTVSGTVQVTANASDNAGVAGVRFYLDGVALTPDDTTAPYSISWDTTTAANGTHSLAAVAWDAADNSTTSAAVEVTVANAVPDTTAPNVAIASPSQGATVSGVVEVTANASDDVGVAGVRFHLDGSPAGTEDTSAPYVFSWSTTTTTNGTHTLTAVARDEAGNSKTSAPVQVTVANPVPDTTAPTVAISAPASGATVAGTVQISVTASDNVGVAGVQFLLDGSSLGAEDTTAPFAFAWNTALTTNGTHTLTAVARDAAGNTRTSAPVSVNVANSSTPSPRPFTGTPFPVPGRFEAEDFDRGGEGVGYHDLTPGNQGGFYRRREDVDIISPYSGGYVVNNFQRGEWLEYTINVTQSGTYRLEALVSSEYTGSRFRIAIDGVDRTGAVVVPTTGSWWTFRMVGAGSVSLSAGEHILRISSVTEYFNVDAISLTLDSGTASGNKRRAGR